jgi:hypothetical protein
VSYYKYFSTVIYTPKNDNIIMLSSNEYRPLLDLSTSTLSVLRLSFTSGSSSLILFVHDRRHFTWSFLQSLYLKTKGVMEGIRLGLGCRWYPLHAQFP